MSDIIEFEFDESQKFNEGILTKNEFIKGFKNLDNITFDNEGIEYTEGYSRSRYLRLRRNEHKPFRCMEIDPQEKNIKNNFLNSRKCDIFYTFEKFTNKLPIHITHFQVRKNFMLTRENEIVYTTEYGIQAYDLFNNTKKDLCSFISQESDLNSDRFVICFDITETFEGDYLIVTGNSDGSVRIFRIVNKELDKVRSNKCYFNKTKCDMLCTEIIAQGNSDEILTNYVKFIEKGKYLLTTSNDCFIRIYSLEERLVQIASYKSNFPVNHCSINFENEDDSEFNRKITSGNNVIASIGDSNLIELFDLHNSVLITRYKGHYDNGTVVKFLKGNEFNFATGNQDLTCKIWDLRKLKNITLNNDSLIEPQRTLCSNMDSVGDIAIINRDLFAYCENYDYFNIYNIKNDTIQSINYIGYFAGVAYQKSHDKIHIAIKESNLNGILTYDRIKNYTNSLNYIDYF